MKNQEDAKALASSMQKVAITWNRLHCSDNRDV